MAKHVHELSSIKMYQRTSIFAWAFQDFWSQFDPITTRLTSVKKQHRFVAKFNEQQVGNIAKIITS